MAYLQAKRLHERAVSFSDEELERATLLPFFDRTGIVRKILIVDLARGAARVLQFEKPRNGRLIHAPFFKKHVVVRAAFEDLPIVNIDEAATLGELWHFDPWWLLTEPPFDTQKTTPVLKATNCAHLFELKDPNLTYRRDLSRVRWLFDGGDNQSNGQRWSEALLPEHHPEVAQPTPSSRRTRWVLDPVWTQD